MVITSVEVLILTQIRIKSKKKGQNDNGLILGRVSLNTRTRPSPSNALLLGRVLGLDLAHSYCECCLGFGSDKVMTRKLLHKDSNVRGVPKNLKGGEGAI